MDNKDVVLKVRTEGVKSSKYFQPVITNNTVIISATRLSEGEAEVKKDNKSETPVYKNIGSVAESKAEDKALQDNSASMDKVKYVNLSENNSTEIKKEEKKEVTQQVSNEEVLPKKENEKSEKEFKIKIEDMAKLFEQNIAKEKTQSAYTNKRDVTSKMELPFTEEPTESIPLRKEKIRDNLKEMKAKLFLLASNAKKPVRICVNKKEFFMGSDYAQMDCVIRNNRYISRCHAKIYYEAACYFIEDTGSMNGTYINGVKLAEGIKYKLETGDIINLADCRFEVDIKN